MTKKVAVQKTGRPEVPAFVDYKNVALLRAYLNVFGGMVSSYYAHTSRKQQKQLARAIKLAREMALLPYTSKY